MSIMIPGADRVQVDSEEVTGKLPPPLMGRAYFLFAGGNKMNSISESYLL